MANDITERFKAEEAIKKSLEEKQILLKEIHHRVKNNLQIICSLFNLQSKYIKNKQVLNILKQSQNRVRSMALIHEILYQSKDFARIDLPQYIKKLINELFIAYRINPNRISIHLKMDKIFISIDKAIPCGLIINELLSNALKYAFPPDFHNKGKIQIELYKKLKIGMKMVVSDNGVGMPEDFNMAESKSLGLHLVCILTEDQLGGKIQLDRKNGTKFSIIFPKILS
jgi:two-component sensor histidine kinase